MRTQSPDTSPEAERVQIELLRKAGEARRFELMRSMSKSVTQWSRESIRQRYPEANEEELAVHFVALCYGQKLADGLQAELARRQHL